MPTVIATHFEALRHRFPAESGRQITNAQQSFEMMEFLAALERPPESRCAYFELGGIPFLVWEMDEAGDEFRVFATLYAVPLGTIKLSTKPCGVLIVDGFYIDLAALAASIAQHFEATPKIPAEISRGQKKRKLLLFGFAESFGHHFWNEVGGLVSAMKTGLFDSLDGIILGPFDYFNLGPLLHARGKNVWKLKAIGSLVTPDRLMLYHNIVVTEEARRLVLDNAATQAPPAQPFDAHHTICFQIRRHRRPWINEEDKLAEIIATLAREKPGIVFFIDGHSTSQGLIAVKQEEIADETGFFNRLAARLGNAIDLRSTIGMDVNAKINILKHVDLFVGPIGSGGVLSSWLLRKPTIAYGPSSYYQLVRDQEGTVPEGGAMACTVPLEHITDCKDSELSFDVDAEAIRHLIQQAMEREFNSVVKIA